METAKDVLQQSSSQVSTPLHLPQSHETLVISVDWMMFLFQESLPKRAKTSERKSLSLPVAL